MHDLAADLLVPVAAPASVRLHGAALRMAARLADLLDLLDPAASHTAPGLRAIAAAGHAGPTFDGTCLDRPGVPPDPIDRLAMAAALLPVELDLLVLAGCAHEHEVVAAALRRLHPQGRSAATPGLAAQLAEHGLLPGLPTDPTHTRTALRHVLTGGGARRAGILDLQPPGVFWDQSLAVDPSLWGALHGDDDWPEGITSVVIEPVLTGLEGWLTTPDGRAAQAALHQGAPVTVEIAAERPLAAASRGVVLAAAAGRSATTLLLAAGSQTHARAAAAAAAARAVVPVLVSTTTPPDLDGVPVPVIVCVPADSPHMPVTRPTVHVAMTSLDRRARRRLWDTVAPGTACPSGLEPLDVAALQHHMATRAALGAPAPNASTERTSSPCPGATLVHPAATWDDLVLAGDALAQLREAADRGAHEHTVLHQWRFLKGRPGASGLRLLFCGPPGTGKTLAAEVLARELERDLLVVDLSQLVSKWIGETEKNLAAAFDAAERGDCVLFFDEADALFGRRTEVGDARDRYANLETAYLLGRLERFDGVAVLATNLRQNIDAAFGRRLEFIVPFDPPGAEERRALWGRHLPAEAPVDDDVDLDGLAAVYAVVGAHIRNASVAAAYLAASAPAGPEPIGARHLLHALSREYDKSGLAFPGLSPDRFERKEPGWRQ
jgi:hypothetical protein